MTTIQEEMAAFDRDQRQAFIDAHAAQPHRPWQEVEVEVKDKFRERYLSILARYNNAPIYRIPFPAPHVCP